jgi:subtilisin family serine protease
MKRINITQQSDSKKTTWLPWGLGGLIWRYLVFLCALVGFLIILFLLSKEHHDRYDPFYDNDYEFEIPDDFDGLDDGLRDIIYGEDPVDRNIDDPVDELPSPDENRLPDFDDDDIITSPSDSLKMIVGDRLNVILNSDADDSTFNRFAQEFKQNYPGDDYSIVYYNSLTKMMQIVVPPSARQRVKANLPRQISDIDFKIFEEEIFDNYATSYNDPALSDQAKSWHLPMVQAYDAWEITKGSPEIVVAIVDSYIDVSHPELKQHVVKPYSVERQSTNVLPPAGKYSFDNDDDSPIYHGTHVAALAVGALNNNSGAAGIAPECSLMPISLGRQMTSMRMLDGVLYAIYQGANVINISIGSVFPDSYRNMPIEDQLDYIRSMSKEQEDVWDYVFKLAKERNCLIVWAAGNFDVVSGLDETKRNATTIRVSAVDEKARKADFSNYGNFNSSMTFSDLSAPGSNIYSAGPGNAYGMCGGTSMAAPIVTGAVALMKSLNPNMPNDQIVKILKETGRPIADTQKIGNLIQIRDALKAVGGKMANFDEIKKNPNELVGTWETTEQRVVIDVESGEPTGKMCHIFLKFKTPSSGTILYKEDDGTTYQAPFTARITNDRIIIDQPNEASSQTSERSFVAVTYICERGKDGLLKCYRKNDPNTVFNLIRIS